MNPPIPAASDPHPVVAQIREKLTQAFTPVALEIKDESARHAGHAPRFGHAPQGGGTHFKVKIVSAAFAGQARLARHRAVYAALAEVMAEQVHALALETLTPEEDAAQGN